MKQNIYKRLEELEKIHAAALQAIAYRSAEQSGAEVFRELMRKLAIEPLPGESPLDAFARATGISGRDLVDLLRKRLQEASR